MTEKNSFRIIFGLGVFLTALAIGGAAMAVDLPSIDLSRIPNYHSPKAPGTAPPLNLADYAPYRNAGNNTLVIRPFMRYFLDDGKSIDDLRCVDTSGLYRPAAFLYPETAYTAYLFRSWAASFAGQEFTGDNGLPGLSGTGVANIPKILNPLNANGVVRREGCDDDGWVTFKGVPDGTYFFVADLPWYPDVQHWGKTVYVWHSIYDPDLDRGESFQIPEYVTGKDVYTAAGYGVAAFDLTVRGGVSVRVDGAAVDTVLKYLVGQWTSHQD